jgi:hypothetical protein
MSINININYKNPNHIKPISNHIKQEGKQDNKGEHFKTKSRGSLLMAKHVHMSLIMTYKLLSSLHKRIHQQCGHVHLHKHS